MRRFAAVMLTVLALLALSIPVEASRPLKFLSAATTNATLARGGTVKLYTIVAVNTTTTLYYLKLYDKGSAPTCNTDEVRFTVALPFGASNAGYATVISVPDGLDFDLGLAFCITAGSADNDNTAAATGITLALSVK